ncbi:hypothetical protein FKW77_010001 [Venturia effusa]|uniref:Heterokaryon incompatibility domain-containing protein n=1 Tax=Venturia effusa TaxID=50376 RepID=A0A517KXH7_9PEZI|nr:hypothetical protein FKW77_010001 [Venturia effusa]
MTDASSNSFGFDDEYILSEAGPSNHYDGHGLPDFEYAPIASEGQTIRLLKLIAGIPRNPKIDCELVETSLDSPKHIKYEALSWCWGVSQEEDYIRIRGKRGKAHAKKAKPDLVKALLALRHEKWDRYLWIDAVCINQKDMDEKNQQVEMMAEIYGKAKRVCVWLGQPDPSSQIAIRFIRDEVLKLQDFDDLCDKESNSPKWKALLDLMQRPWFSRRWVVQEISLARKALLYCGLDRISWNKFSVAVELFVEVETATHRLSEVMKRDRKFHHIPGWFDYVSQLGASLLVDATGKLFRDHKEIGGHISAKMKRLGHGNSKHAMGDSDSEGLSDESSWEEDPDLQDDDDLSSKDHDSSPTNEPKANRKTHETSHLSSQMSTRPPTVKGQPLLSLEVLVSSLAIFDVTNAHDTIYALLAISKDTTPKATNSRSWQNHTQAALEQFTEQRRYEVDYKKPYVDVCQYFIRFCIHRALKVDGSRALDLILRPWAVEEAKVSERFDIEFREQEEKQKREAEKQRVDRTRTSAKTRLTANHERTESDDKSQTLLRREDYLPLPSWIPQISRAPFAMQRAAGVSGPKVGRTNADPLVGVPNQNVRNYKAAETKELDFRTLKFRKRIGHGPDNYYSMFVKGFVLDTIVEVKDASQSGNIPSEWADFAGWTRAQGDPPDAFWRTLVGDRGRDGKNPPVYYARACKESFEKGGYLSGSISTSDLIRNERVSVIAQFCWRVQSVIWKRALANTESGKLALVAPGVKGGDLVCILYGCSVPVILRMSDAKSEDQVIKEAAIELEVLRQQMTRCAKIWLARTRYYRERRNRGKDKYQVWEMTKKLLFYKDSEWRTDWGHRRKARLEQNSSPGSKEEIARRERFERRPISTDGKMHKTTEHLIDDTGGNAPETTATNEEQQKVSSSTPALQNLGPGRVKSEWEYITGEFQKPRLTLDEIRKKGFRSRYHQHLEACAFDDWKKEKRGKARELRDKKIIDGTAPVESSWDEPTVNWRAFELGLKYGRKWKRILKKLREDEEEKMMNLRDQHRKEKGFKLRDRPAKRKPRFLDTEEFVEGTNKRTKLTKESAKEAEGIWLDNVKRVMRNEKRDEPSEHAEDIDDGGEGTERSHSPSSRAKDPRPESVPESSETEANVEKSRQSYLYSYTLLGDCYLHGMMDGEAMAAQNGHSSTKTIPAVVFEIR